MKIRIPKKFKVDMESQLNLAGVNAMMGAVGVFILNIVAGLQEPLKTIIFYVALLATGIATSRLIFVFMKKQRLNLKHLQKNVGIAAGGFMLLFVTNEFLARWIVPQFGYSSIAPLSIGEGGGSVYPFLLVSLVIVGFAYVTRR